MPKISLLSKLKVNSTAIIEDFTGKGENNNFRYYLIAMGFVPGRNVKIVKKAYGMFMTKVDNDLPLGIGGSAAKSILVRVQDDIFEKTDNKEKENFFSKIIKLFKKR